jgi:hypothetical protein
MTIFFNRQILLSYHPFKKKRKARKKIQGGTPKTTTKGTNLPHSRNQEKETRQLHLKNTPSL